MKTDIAAMLVDIRLRLRSISETPSLDAEVLIAHALQVDRTWVVAHSTDEIPRDVIPWLEEQTYALAVGYPLPYILGEWEFYGLRFMVNPAVLIPRPETELLVEYALQWLKNHPQANSAMDVGTGSGCIPISIATHHPSCHWVAGDISRSALLTARQNIVRYQLVNTIHLIQTDVLNGLHTGFDLICSNPPYIPAEKLMALQVSQYEPILALDGGKDGNQFLSCLLQQAVDCIHHPGKILCEIEETLADTVLETAHLYFPDGSIEIFQDLAGKPRLLSIEVQ